MTLSDPSKLNRETAPSGKPPTIDKNYYLTRD